MCVCVGVGVWVGVCLCVCVFSWCCVVGMKFQASKSRSYSIQFSTLHNRTVCMAVALD